MKSISDLYWFFKGVKVYALVGDSGTGKSFRAKLLAQKYGIELILDDGLLIGTTRSSPVVRQSASKRSLPR
jgi:adenylate kinase family enzyme